MGVERFEAHPGQPLQEHLRNVSEIAGRLAEPIGASASAMAVGMAHDIGKATPRFQGRLAGEGDGRPVFHKDEGAIRLYDCGDGLSHLAMAVEGHHGGLVGWKTDAYPTRGLSCLDLMRERHDAVPDETLRRLCPGFHEATRSAFEENMDHFEETMNLSAVPGSNMFEMAMRTRMLFGCLVEADFLDTERAVDGDRSSIRGGDDVLDPDAAMGAFTAYMDRKRSASADSPVQRARDAFLRAGLAAAGGERGVYGLYGPTGIGKTNTSMGFSVEHARVNHLRRIIFLAPFTAITDQAYDDFRTVFGEDAVLECASTWDVDDAVESEEDAARLALKAEDWRAPFVVSTDVQFFDSLFGCGVAKLRKLPAIFDSMIVIDELQSIPPDRYRQVMDVLSYLVKWCGCSVLVMSATLPPIDGFVKYGVPYRQVIPDAEVGELKETLGTRVEIDEVGMDLMPDSLAELVSPDVSTLIVLNTRKQVDEVFKACDGRFGGAVPVFALTRNMTRVHRERVLDEVRALLSAGKPCVLVSTVIVEAGIDLDFHEGFRCATGLASVFQAAGRVNRNGFRATGKMHVFDFAEDTGLRSDGWRELKREKDRTVEVFSKFDGRHIYDDAAMSAYMASRYSNIKLEWDEHVPAHTMFGKRASDWDFMLPSFNFPKWADELRMIPDDGYHRTVLVPFAAWMDEVMAGRCRDLFERLEGVSVSGRVSFVPRKMQREMADFSVDVPVRVFDELRKMGMVKRMDGTLNVWYVSEEAVGCYDDDLGLIAPYTGA